MKATIFYIELTDKMYTTIKENGWGCPMGRTYMDAKEGVVDAATEELFQPAAVMEAETEEEIFFKLQNLDTPWTDRDDVECVTDFPRSMSVGDRISWDDGRVMRCAIFGFEKVEFPA